MIFINFSNTPSAKWGQEQKTAALQMINENKKIKHRKIIDILFPTVLPEAHYSIIEKMAEKNIQQFKRMLLPAAEAVLRDYKTTIPVVHIMGEIGLSSLLAMDLIAMGIRAVHSTYRCETALKPDGTRENFNNFVCFRPYAFPQRERWIATAHEWAEEAREINAAAERMAAEAKLQAKIESEIKYSDAVDNKPMFCWLCQICGEIIAASRPMPKIKPEGNPSDGIYDERSIEYLAPFKWVLHMALNHKCKI